MRETVHRPLWRRVLVRLLVVLGVVEAVWVAGGLILVKSGQVGRWINKKPEKTLITFDSVWPIVPGVVRVRNFRIVNQGRSDQLEGKVDVVWGAVNPLELPARRVHVVWLRCRGVEFRIRKRPATAEEASRLRVGYPEIEGVAWEPYAPPPGAAPQGKKKGKGTTIVFTRSHLDDVREVWLFERRLRGKGRVVASVTVFGDGPIAIPHADVRFEDARIDNGPEETYADLKLRVLGKMARYDTKVTKGLGILGLIRAQVEVAARMPSGAGYLNAFLRNAPWIRFDGGEAALSARLSVGDGKVAPASFVELTSTDRQAEVGGFFAHGTARTRLDVVEGRGAVPDARLAVDFDRYELKRGKDAKEPLMIGQGLRIAVTAPASLSEIPPKTFAGRLELGKAELPKLDFLNALFPAGSRLRIRSGRASVDGAFDVAAGGASCRGAMKVAAAGLGLDTGGVAMTGAFTLDVAIPKGDLLQEAFDVDGTRLSLDRFAFDSRHDAATAPDWNASVAFPEGHIALAGGLATRGRLTLHASDSRPVAAFLSKDKPLSGWKKKLVTVGAIDGEGRFSLSRGRLEVQDFKVGWDGAEVRARFRTDERGAWGKALVRYGILKAGIGLEGKERHLRVLGPESWFEKR
jgi:hypothetical protein